MSRASDNTKAAMKNNYSESTQFSVMYVHDLLVFFATLVTL